MTGFSDRGSRCFKCRERVAWWPQLHPHTEEQSSCHCIKRSRRTRLYPETNTRGCRLHCSSAFVREEQGPVPKGPPRTWEWPPLGRPEVRRPPLSHSPPVDFLDAGLRGRGLLPRREARPVCVLASGAEGSVCSSPRPWTRGRRGPSSVTAFSSKYLHSFLRLS